jgi:RNA polymerase sigma-70 factor (ECF subfamily)
LVCGSRQIASVLVPAVHHWAVVMAFATATAPHTSVRSTLTSERHGRPNGGAAVVASAERTDEVDPGVLAAAQHGDDEAFVDIMRYYDRRLRIVAFHVLNDRQLMDDVMQDVTLRVYRSLPRFRGESSLGTWLCRITYRACCDAMTRAGRLQPLPPEELPDAPDPAPDPAEILATRTALAEAFAALPPEQRLAVLLVDREGYDYATTATVLDVPMGTLASRLSAARATLRRTLTSSLSLEVD